MNIVEAIQAVTAKMQEEISSGRRSTHIDAVDLYGVLLEIAERADQPDAPPATTDPNLLRASQEAQQVLDRCAAIIEERTDLGRTLTRTRANLAAQLRRFGLTQ